MASPQPPPVTAVIREAECIGCTKCLAVCPVDAIIGAAKQLHTVVAADCTGCALCLPPCPVDCIDLVSWDGAKRYAAAPGPQQAVRDRRKPRAALADLGDYDRVRLGEEIAAAVARARARRPAGAPRR